VGRHLSLNTRSLPGQQQGLTIAITIVI